jgi:hypothetical protein
LILVLIAACAAWAQTPTAPANKPAGQASATTAQAPAQEKKLAAPAAKAVQPAAKKPVATPAAAPAATKKAAAATTAAKPAPAAAKSATPAAAKNPAGPAATKPATKPAPKPMVAPAAQPAPATAKKPAASATKTTATKPAPKKSSADTPRVVGGAPETAKPAPAAKPAPKIVARRGRDPFVSPIVKRFAGPPCSTGKACLAVDDILIKGTAKTDNGMLAVVENSARKAYILRENDPVFNGFVVKITMDSVIFRENVTDRLGHTSTREITKKIPTTPVA